MFNSMRNQEWVGASQLSSFDSPSRCCCVFTLIQFPHATAFPKGYNTHPDVIRCKSLPVVSTWLDPGLGCRLLVCAPKTETSRGNSKLAKSHDIHAALEINAESWLDKAPRSSAAARVTAAGSKVNRARHFIMCTALRSALPFT